MRSKGSRFIPFHSGGLGVECVRSTLLRLWSQQSATVHNRPQPFAGSPYGRAYVASSAEGVLFGSFKRLVDLAGVAGVALRYIRMCFVTCRKSFCVAGAIFLRCFQKTGCSFRGRRSTLDVPVVILRGRRSTLDVSCCESHWQGCVKWRQGADSVAGVAVCEMCWKLMEASQETLVLR